MKSNWKRNSIIYIIILVAFVVLFSVFLPGTESREEVPLSDVITMSQNKEIEKIEVDGEDLIITKIDGTKLESVKEANSTIYEITGLVLDGVIIDVKPPSGFGWSVLINFIPLLIFGALLFFLFRQARGANNQAMSFGRSKVGCFLLTGSPLLSTTLPVWKKPSRICRKWLTSLNHVKNSSRWGPVSPREYYW